VIDRPNPWRFWWSLIWRQALVMAAATVAMGALVALLKALGAPGWLFFKLMPYLTTSLAIYSGYEASRRVIIVYDVRNPGAHREQDHRHRR
jgi:hypothetical protein